MSSQNKMVQFFSHKGAFGRKVASSFSSSLLRNLRVRSYQERAHMRVGRFSIVTFEKALGEWSLLAGKSYDEVLLRDDQISHDPARVVLTLRATMADRLSQLNTVERILLSLQTEKKEHPLHAEIMADIRAEREMFATRVPEVCTTSIS